MSEALTPDQRVAKRLGIAPDQVRCARDDWNASQTGVLMREVFSERLERQITERLTSLKTIFEDKLKQKQGEIAGLELALRLVSPNPLTNE